MKSKVLKIGTVLLTCVCLISFIVLPVSALSVNDYGFIISNQRFGATNEITPNISYYSYTTTNQYGDNQIEFKFPAGNGSSSSAYRPMSFDLTAGNSNPQYSVNLQFVSYYADSSNNVFGFDGPAWAYINTTRVTSLQSYSRTPSNNSSLFYSGGSFTFTINANETKKISISSGYNESYLQTVGYGVWITVSPIDQSGAIIDNQNENTQDIIDNQNSNTEAEIEAGKENTDKILNDWDGGENVDDGTADNFKDAEDAALGGKTDSQIQEEINNAIDFDINIFDSAKIGKMHSLFDNVLSACGSSYQALFMLCLTLGLAAFLIGRRYG